MVPIAGKRPRDDARLRHRLLCRIGRRYATVTQPLKIGGLDLDFTRIADPDVVLDQVAQEVDLRQRLTGRREEHPPHLPYWAELWDSGLAIGQWLVGRFGDGRLPANRPGVLDLGCGMGLAGAVAAKLGCDVLLADLESPALCFARLNCAGAAGRIRTRRLNWQSDLLDERFDLILGSDILYERGQWEHLETFWRDHLVRGGTVLLGEPGRQTGDVFPDWITQRGWDLQQLEHPVPTRPRPVRLFLLTPAN